MSFEKSCRNRKVVEPHMMSRGEIKISDILAFNNIDFEREYSFPDLVGYKQQPLRFDFCIFSDDGSIDFLIEYQGEQHYIAKTKFGGSAGLKKQQTYDRLKREYCEKHNYTLVIIPYWDENRINYDYIMKLAGY